MKHLFVVNPTAGGKDKTDYVRSLAVSAFCGSEDSFEIYVTKAPMDAPKKIRAAAADGEPLRVYACGGDGTFNECVCGAALLPHVAVCPFPTGTGNDFCRMFGEEKDLYRDLDALIHGSVHPIDLIDCNGRMSANICCVGIDARIGIDVHTYTGSSLIRGPMAYIVSAAVNVFRGINTPMHVRCGDFETEGEHALVAACNGRYYGGGFNPSLKARPDDGILDFYIVKGVSLLKLAQLIGEYAAGKADDYPDYITHLRGDSIQLDLPAENVICVDGEAIYAKQIRMKLLPRALNLIVPRGMCFFEEPER